LRRSTWERKSGHPHKINAPELKGKKKKLFTVKTVVNSYDREKERKNLPGGGGKLP